MNNETDHQPERRTPLVRCGVTALNLVVPGLGLARLGEWRVAVPFLVAGFALIGLITFGMGHFPITGYDRVVLALLTIVALLAALYVVPAVLTWRHSRFRSAPYGWSRWYVLASIAIAVLTLSHFAAPTMHHFYKPFYAPSESMAPTIGKGDKFIADMRWRVPFKRGEIDIFNDASGFRVDRIAGIPGDLIAMRAGVPVVNGSPAAESRKGATTFVGGDGVQPATLLTERLPGEASVHSVLDTGPYEADEMQQIIVPANHLFVLGDNRDWSADSRVPPEFGGVGMVPYSAIVGRPMYIHWSSDRLKIGTRLDR
jgi:signal peptidase I